MLFHTVPSFKINKKEFFLLWVKNTLLEMNMKVVKHHLSKQLTSTLKLARSDELEGQLPEEVFLATQGIVSADQIQNQTQQIRFDYPIAPTDAGQERFKSLLEADSPAVKQEVSKVKKIWALKNSDILKPKFLRALLELLSPSEFSSESEFQTGAEELQVLDELLFQLKSFFIARNLEGKSLFKVLIKQADPSRRSANLSTLAAAVPEEILWKVLELVFTVAFFTKDNRDSSDCFNTVFNLATTNLEANQMHHHQTSAELRRLQTNALLTKSVVQIIGDTLKQFSAVLPAQGSSSDPVLSFKDKSVIMRTSEGRKYFCDQEQQQLMISSLFKRRANETASSAEREAEAMSNKSLNSSDYKRAASFSHSETIIEGKGIQIQLEEHDGELGNADDYEQSFLKVVEIDDEP